MLGRDFPCKRIRKKKKIKHKIEIDKNPCWLEEISHVNEHERKKLKHKIEINKNPCWLVDISHVNGHGRKKIKHKTK